ncbi:MAG TPA: methylated-DNA--[protein]-cysteine S-methyltransferase [Steroidobacteraceae bacterium]|nr:methylated-DNA--[protein]-cysteine S-methyltransferase [Steroidobacteraceae bacterium]
MSVRCIHLFDTSLGRCGVAWGEHGIVGIQLPEVAGAERAWMLKRFSGAVETSPPRDVQDAIERITSLLGGAPADLAPIALDMSAVPEFDRLVYAAARRIPRGATRSYGEIAAEIGDPGAARAVGAALGRNPFPIVVPCHRVLAAAGRPGGFSAHGGVRTKMRMLEIEGAPGNQEFDF